MATLTSLRTLLVSALVAIAPMTLVHAQHANEYQGERVSFTFPTDEEENWGPEELYFGSTWFFQAWTTEDSDSDEREECILVESHPQDPENPISIDQKFVLFFGSDEPESLSISLLADAPSDASSFLRVGIPTVQALVLYASSSHHEGITLWLMSSVTTKMHPYNSTKSGSQFSKKLN